jgi:MarR family transcriptional regulator, lower aerobic nicotinate degradation pathway regulator
MAQEADNGAVVLVTRLARAAYRDVDEQALGMRLKDFTALSALRDTNGRGQKELGEALLYDANALTQLLNDLEDRDLISRSRDRQDRRRLTVELTEAGRSAVRAAERAINDADATVLHRLRALERAQLRSLLAKALGDDSGLA